MRTTFDLAFDERDDGTHVWAATCRGCGATIVGERRAPVVVIRTLDERAWEHVARTGQPIIIGDPRIEFTTVPDHDGVQRALEAHAAACPRVDS